MRKDKAPAAKLNQKIASEPHQPGIVQKRARRAFQRVLVRIVIVRMQVVYQVAAGRLGGGIEGIRDARGSDCITWMG